MKIELFGIHEKRDAFELRADAASLELGSDDFTVRGPVVVSCSFARDGEIVRFMGQVRAEIMAGCSRCLDEFCFDVSGEFEFVARHLRVGEDAGEYPDFDEEGDDETRLIYVRHDEKTVDITEFVRDALILEIPLKPLCSDDCRGLCPVCGTNLNEETCSCGETRVDDRWKKLEDLLDGDSKDAGEE